MATMTPPFPTTTTPISIVSVDPMPKRWTCQEFHDLNERGAFTGKRPILIDGVILEQGPMNPPHARTVERVQRLLTFALGLDWRVLTQLPLVLGQYTDPMPDLAILPYSTFDETTHPTTASLVVEVSDTTLRFDTKVKRLIYANAGIPEYWVLDVDDRVVHVYLDPDAGDYRSHRTWTLADSITPLNLAITVAVRDLLPSQTA